MIMYLDANRQPVRKVTTTACLAAFAAVYGYNDSHKANQLKIDNQNLAR